MAQPVDVGRPLAQVAALHAGREPFVRGAVAQAGDRDVVVRAAGAVRELQVVEEAGTVVGGDVGAPPVAERVLELVFVTSGDRVHLVQEQHPSR